MKKDKTLQQRISDLEKQVDWFQGDDFDLDEAIDKFSKLEKSASELEKDLSKLKNKVEVLKQKFE